MVYVTQIPERRDPSTGRMAPMYDVSGARVFGDIVVLCPPQASQFPLDLLTTLRYQLRNYTSGDYVLLLGDPIAIAMTLRVIFEKGGVVQVLRWNRYTRSYVPVPIT